LFFEDLNMLHLHQPTRISWVQEALNDIPALLIDHAHCEKKAASTAINLIFKYPQHSSLLKPLSALAREELAHFELVLDHLNTRNIEYCRFAPSAYAGKLMKEVRRDEPYKLLDTLLCCALIEARSCERMKLLSEAFIQADHSDPELAKLYKGLLASEARHHSMYVDLALGLFEHSEVWTRLEELAIHESSVLDQPGRDLRMHS
jgi:tRNA-(ms[2]io[6]A)-hydroxylase